MKSKFTELRQWLIWALLLSLLAACATDGGSDGNNVSGQTGGASMAWDRYCEPPEDYDAATVSRALAFSNLIRHELDREGNEVAIVARTGTDPDRIDIRFTHSGIALKGGEDLPWAVRQMYYACDEGRPRLYDQGFASFMLGTSELDSAHISLLLLPRGTTDLLQAAAEDQTRAVRLVASQYSVNAYPFSTAYQNCNQWVIEMLATALGELNDGEDLRERAQGWLQRNDYDPQPVELGSWWIKFIATLSPLVHLDDHPEPARDGLSIQVSLPSTIESFVHKRLQQTRRIELCWNAEGVVIRRGWEPIAPGCTPKAGDRDIGWEDIAML